MAKRLWELFYTFAKVGVMTFGGGYAMLPILQREVVENKGWATEEELAERTAHGTKPVLPAPEKDVFMMGMSPSEYVATTVR